MAAQPGEVTKFDKVRGRFVGGSKLIERLGDGEESLVFFRASYR